MLLQCCYFLWNVFLKFFETLYVFLIVFKGLCNDFFMILNLEVPWYLPHLILKWKWSFTSMWKRIKQSHPLCLYLFFCHWSLQSWLTDSSPRCWLLICIIHKSIGWQVLVPFIAWFSICLTHHSLQQVSVWGYCVDSSAIAFAASYPRSLLSTPVLQSCGYTIAWSNFFPLTIPTVPKIRETPAVI